MPDRETFLDLIQKAYEHRVRGDKAGVAQFLSPQMTLRIAGDHGSMPWAPDASQGAMPSIAALIDAFEFRNLKRKAEVVEGDRAAILWQVEVRHGGGDWVATELYDFWTIGQDGKLTSLVQFADTALIGRMTGAL